MTRHTWKRIAALLGTCGVLVAVAMLSALAHRALDLEARHAAEGLRGAELLRSLRPGDPGAEAVARRLRKGEVDPESRRALVHLLAAPPGQRSDHALDLALARLREPRGQLPAEQVLEVAGPVPFLADAAPDDPRHRAGVEVARATTPAAAWGRLLGTAWALTAYGVALLGTILAVRRPALARAGMQRMAPYAGALALAGLVHAAASAAAAGLLAAAAVSVQATLCRPAAALALAAAVGVVTAERGRPGGVPDLAVGRSSVLEGSLWGLGFAAWTWLLLFLVPYRLGPLPRLAEAQQALQGLGAAPWIASAAYVVGAAIFEEVVFRFLVPALASARLPDRWAGAVAGPGAALLWAFLHVGALDPAWLKVAQLFPIGVALHRLARDRGLAAACAAHGVLNLLVVAATGG